MNRFYIGDRESRIGDYHSDYTTGYAYHGRYEVIFASAIGLSHLAARHNGDIGKDHREDAVAVAGSGPWLVAAVSDGVGEAILSRYGAAFCVEWAIRNILSRLDCASTPGEEVLGDPTTECGALFWDRDYDEAQGREKRRFQVDTAWRHNAWNLTGSVGDAPYSAPTGDQLKQIMREAYSATGEQLRQFASEQNADINHLACTLQVILLNTETGFLATGYLGDGLITGAWSFAQRELVRPIITGVADTVCPLTSSRWEQFFAAGALPPEIGKSFGVLHMMTDGIADDCLGSMRFPPWAIDKEFRFRRRGHLQERGSELASYIRTYSQSHDDLTLVLLFRTPPTPVPAADKDSEETRHAL